jgi:hypothetical protein
MSLTKASYSMITGAPVNVFDYMTAAQVADVLANTYTLDVTAAVQAALDSGYASIYFPAGTYKISTLTVPSTVRQVTGVGANRAQATNLRFDTGQTLTNGLLISTGCSGLAVSGLHLQFRTGSYTNGIFIDNDNHFQTWTNVTTDDSANPGTYRVANHWVIDNSCWSNVFHHCGAWGPDVSDVIGLTLNNSANDIDFYSCRWVHCGIGVYLPGASMEVQNFWGGEIASNVSYGVHIGNTSGTSAATLEVLNFNGVYFEDQPVHIYQNMPDMKGLNAIGCRTSETAWSSFIKLNQTTYTVKIIGGTFIRASGGTGYLIDVNNKTIVDATIDNSYMFQSQPYVNEGAQQVAFRTNRIGSSPGQISYETQGIETRKDFNTTYSYAGKILDTYYGNAVYFATQERGQSVVWDAVVPGGVGSLFSDYAFKRGDVVWNNAATAGGNAGWMCITAGTPGTWKAMANLAA